MIAIGLRRLVVSAALAGAVVAMLAAASTQAATVTIGSQFTSAYTSAFTPIAQTSANTALPPPLVAASPVDGTVINWRFVGLGPLTPRVLRPAGGGGYTGAGTGPTQSGAAGVLTEPFPLNLPIKQGDVFGVDTQPGSSFYQAPLPGTTRLSWVPPLLDGESRAPSLAVSFEWAVGAIVRYCIVPDLKGRKLGVAREALTAAECTVGTVDKTKKRRKRKKVLSQAVAPGTSISNTQPVDLRVSRKKK